MNYQEIADLASKSLNDDNEWEKRYYDYSEEIAKNKKYVTAVCKCFQPKAPLTKYLSIGKVKDVKFKVDIDLRIMGASVATITVNPDKNLRDRAEKDENIANEIQKAAKVIFNKKGLDKVKDKLTQISNDLKDSIKELLGKKTVCGNGIQRN